MKNHLETTWDKVIEENSARLLRVALGVLHNEEDAKDACQEAFLQMLRTPGIQNYSAWLYRTVIHRAINMRKQNQTRQRRENQHLRLVSEENKEKKLEHQEQLEKLQNRITTLPEQQRNVFLLRHQGRLSIKEIAQTLQVSEGTIKKQLHRALENLRQEKI